MRGVKGKKGEKMFFARLLEPLPLSFYTHSVPSFMFLSGRGEGGEGEREKSEKGD